ncbi:MAG: NAD(P)-dependent oxidoreductase [Spirochaetes bacterium]|nr:NAD(P)-dependent oxidoreductase [Spirochaetota bacterium]
MKKAIITGATGLVGMAVARHLTSIGIEVLSLGRQNLSSEDISRSFGLGSRYLQLAMAEIALLAEHIELMEWSPGDECVFFNFAWQGRHKLTDGTFKEQLTNAVYSTEALRTAKKLGCIKFINAGTLEETVVEQFLLGKTDDPFQSTQTNYALAKLASRDMCKMVAFLEKIDYVHTRLSVPLAPDLTKGSYVATTLKKISEGVPYDRPKNMQLFDIILIDDVARAFYLIGLSGKNKADYFIGTSRPATLAQYFEAFESLVNIRGSENADFVTPKNLNTVNFETETLHRDTGFIATALFQNLLKALRRP